MFANKSIPFQNIDFKLVGAYMSKCRKLERLREQDKKKSEEKNKKNWSGERVYSVIQTGHEEKCEVCGNINNVYTVVYTTEYVSARPNGSYMCKSCFFNTAVYKALLIS